MSSTRRRRRRTRDFGDLSLQLCTFCVLLGAGVFVFQSHTLRLLVRRVAHCCSVSFEIASAMLKGSLTLQKCAKTWRELTFKLRAGAAIFGVYVALAYLLTQALTNRSSQGYNFVWRYVSQSALVVLHCRIVNGSVPNGLGKIGTY